MAESVAQKITESIAESRVDIGLWQYMVQTPPGKCLAGRLYIELENFE